MTSVQGLNHVSAISHLRAMYPSLSPSERLVADNVLNNPEDVIRMTIAEMADRSGVSGATAVRFFKSLGYDSFLDLKIALTRDLPDTPFLIHDEISERDTPISIAHKVFHETIQAIEDTLSVLDRAKFEQALVLLENADRILVIGTGPSAPMAEVFRNRLLRLQMNCHIEVEAYLQLVQTSLLGEKDVLIIISQTGETTGPIRMAKEARIRKCPVICITGNHFSPLAEISDVVLISVSHETRLETLSSRVAQHTLIQAIYVALAIRSLEKTIRLERIILDTMTRRPGSGAG